MTTSTNFSSISVYSSSSYRILPFRFIRRSEDEYFLTNLVGEFVRLSRKDFLSFIRYRLPEDSSVYRELISRHFLASDGKIDLDLIASKLWTKKSFIAGFTKLHIFVLTLRCNNSCTYCQASRQNVDAPSFYDMDKATARASVRLMMQSPCKDITVEFQGGEPLLNFEVLKEIVLYTKKLNEDRQKNISFVVCTNLSLLDENKLDFLALHDIGVSTSLDGPAQIHDRNRCRNIKDASHEVVVQRLLRVQEKLGRQKVSALMTTTRDSLHHSKELIDEYIKLGIGSIFIRSLNPYGFAIKTKKSIGYSVDEFVQFYKECLDYILEINKKGFFFPEAFATLLLRKILTPWPVGFVDLQSPTGNGFGVTVYNYDSEVYASDESRMLAEMGDTTFHLGNVLRDSYQKIFFGEVMQLLASTGTAETLAGCTDCAYVPYCGADPVRHYATQGDAYGNRTTSDFCKKNKAILDLIFEKIFSEDPIVMAIFWSWVRDCPLEETLLREEDAS